MAEEQKKYLGVTRDSILGLTEIDQDLAVIETIYAPKSKAKAIARIEEVTATLLRLRDEIKELKPESYITKPK